MKGGDTETYRILHAGGWTLLTAVNLMLFCLLHHPCSTTIYTIYKETRSVRWTALSVVLPITLGVLVTVLVAAVWRAVGGDVMLSFIRRKNAYTEYCYNLSY